MYPCSSIPEKSKYEASVRAHYENFLKTAFLPFLQFKSIGYKDGILPVFKFVNKNENI